jgi:putative photosynthetic complex assembly protein
MQAHHDPAIPRPVLLSAGALLAATFLIVAVARLGGYSPHSPDAPSRVERSLSFADLADGGIAVVDVATGTRLETVHGEQGFLRGTLRSVARERKRRGVGPEDPLQLIGRADGRLTLVDPATDLRIDLESFGPTNAAVYARWLISPSTSKVTP